MSKEKRRPAGRIPKFESEDAEREFLATTDCINLVDYGKAGPTLFPYLKQSLRTVSVRSRSAGSRCWTEDATPS